VVNVINLDELQKEIHKIIEEATGIKQVTSRIMLLMRQSIKDACEFYLKYKDNPELFIKEFPMYKSEFVRKCLTINLPEERLWLSDGTVADKNKYNEWLFKLAFKDFIKGDE